MAALKPAFTPGGVITAGNSSQISDGSAALLITTSEKAAELGLTPLARIHTAVLAGADPVIMLTAPIPATQKALRRSGLTIDQIGVAEINEAFAPVPLAWLAELGADPKVLNPNGGAIALGHPLGASGARAMTTLVYRMRDHGIRYGLQAMCEGGGQANATILELLVGVRHMRRTVYEPEHEQFREVVREFIAREVAPHGQAWEQAGIVDREVYRAAGKHGVIGFNVPEEFGGGGVADFRFNAVVSEELAKAGPGTPAFTLHNDVVAPYLTSLATPEQQQRWLPGFAAGDLIGAIAMTEPGAGSDLAGVRTHANADGGAWILSGAKTFISSGINADLVIVVTRTDPTRPPGTGPSACWSWSGACPASAAGATWTRSG